MNIKEEGGTAILPNPIAENKEDINDEERLQWKIAGKFVTVLLVQDAAQKSIIRKRGAFYLT